eukprot:TRINITY_DN4301_c0_g1_i3.p2 TRINITY_DN4301_c0_g1~~TRINITY_DN4301_c0_g1_i3.p2  ORF type:complete len:232 (+),score=25.38 TRINITY_DN4301_c0_g1_i3:28-723(+)
MTYDNILNHFVDQFSLPLSVKFLDSFWKPEYNSYLVGQQERVIVSHVLINDLRNCCSKGTLARFKDIQQRQILQGKFILQVDEIVNIHAAYKNRYNDNDNKRCLKLILCDGDRQIIGVENKRIPELNVNTSLGIKLLLTNPWMMNNKLYLTQENVTILGGKVQYLEDARLRMMEEWKKPLMFENGENKVQKYQKSQEVLKDAAWKELISQHIEQDFEDLDLWLSEFTDSSA